MRGVLLDRNGRPELPEHLRHGFGRPEGARPDVIHSWVNPALGDIAVPPHVQANLDRAASDVHDVRAGMQGWQEVVSQNPADATAVTNTTTETIMIPDFVWPNAGPHAWYVGKMARVVIWGRVSTVVTTPGTITFRLRWGGVAGTTLVTSKAQRPKTTVSTNMAAQLWFIVQCRAIGTAGSLFVMGQNNLANTIGDAQAAQESVWPDAPAAVSINTGGNVALSPTVAFSVATATTSWQTHIGWIETLN
jgi:hypothetical protein